MLLSLAAATAVGWLAVAAAWPRAAHPTATAAPGLRIALALGLGLGLSASWFFLWASLAGTGRGATLLGDALLLLAAWQLARRRAASGAPPAPLPRAGFAPLGRGMGSVAVLLALVAVATAVAVALRHPHGDGDGAAIWNMRARYLWTAWGAWDAVLFPQGLVHVDYPLLLPALVVRSWAWAGEPGTLAPIALGFAFTAATAGVLFGALAALRGRATAALGVIVLLGTPFFVRHGVEQTADAPLAFFALAAVALIMLHRSSAPHPGLLVLAALAAGCAAWTKNEGVLLAGLLLLPLLVRAGPLPLLAGALLPAAALAWFKLALAPANDLAGQPLDQMLARAGDPARWGQVARAFAERAVWLADRPPVQCGFALLGLYALATGRARAAAIPWLPACVLLAMAAVYFLIFVLVSPYDLRWHLPTAVNRLLLQLWPATILVVLAALRAPGEPRVGTA